MTRYLTSAIFTDVAVTMSTFIANRREPWYEAISSTMIDSAHRANQVPPWRVTPRPWRVVERRQSLTFCGRRPGWLPSGTRPAAVLPRLLTGAYPGFGRMRVRRGRADVSAGRRGGGAEPVQRLASKEGASFPQVNR